MPHGQAPTIRANGPTPLHYAEDRCINVREAACLQSFPLHYRFHGSLTSQYRQIGKMIMVLYLFRARFNMHFYPNVTKAILTLQTLILYLKEMQCLYACLLLLRSLLEKYCFMSMKIWKNSSILNEPMLRCTFRY